MEIPIVFETSKVSISSHAVTNDEKTRPQVARDSFGRDVSRDRRIPITMESREKKVGHGAGEDFLSAASFRDTSPKKSEAYFEIPINFPASRDEKWNGRGARDVGKQIISTSPRKLSAPAGSTIISTNPRKLSAGATWRDAEKQAFALGKPNKRSEIVVEVLPSKKMVTKSSSFDDDFQEMKKEMDSFRLDSSSREKNEKSRLEGKESNPEHTVYSSENEAGAAAGPESSHVAFTKEEIGIMREEISKLEKIAEIMKNAALVWSRANELSGDGKDDQQKIKSAEELLTQDLLELDKIEVEGNEQIRGERKKAVNAIESLLKNLEEKMKPATN